jgi:hypothetical protein
MSEEGVLSYLLWNLVVDRLLAATNDQDFGYADDIAIIVLGKFANTVRELRNEALSVTHNWTAKYGLNISPYKTAVIPFTNRRVIEGLRPLTLHGKQLQILDKIKYLGVT